MRRESHRGVLEVVFFLSARTDWAGTLRLLDPPTTPRALFVCVERAQGGELLLGSTVSCCRGIWEPV